MPKPIAPETMSEVRLLLENIGKQLPDRKRVPATKLTRNKMEPQGTIYVAHKIDTYEELEVDTRKNNLAGKKLVLFFGKESHGLTRIFHVPKMAAIYQNLTTSRDDVEFLFVGLTEMSETEYNRFSKTMTWPCVPYKNVNARQRLEEIFYTPLKKKHGICSLAVLDADHTTILNIDGEPKLAATHDDTGFEFPWAYSNGETAAAVAAGTCLCTIM